MLFLNLCCYNAKCKRKAYKAQNQNQILYVWLKMKGSKEPSVMSVLNSWNVTDLKISPEEVT